MSQITLNLKDEAARAFAEFYGWTERVNEEQDDGSMKSVANPLSAEDYTAQTLLTRIQNDLIEKRNRDAIAAVADQPMPDITTDGESA